MGWGAWVVECLEGCLRWGVVWGQVRGSICVGEASRGQQGGVAWGAEAECIEAPLGHSFPRSCTRRYARSACVA